MAIESQEEAARYLEALINVEGRLGEGIDRDGLGAMHDLMDALDHPERCAPSIHVAGSKGKGSVVLFLEAILTALGQRVGAFTSPHLSRWTERYRVAGAEVSGDAFARAVDTIQPLVTVARRDHPGRAPSFFDAATAAGFMLFRDAKVDRIVAEVGLGGRLDATNVLQPEMTCIAHLELEHTDRLGETLPEIAFEKGGIIKPGVPCVVGELDPAARAVIAQISAERGAPLMELGRDFTAQIEPRADPLLGSRLVYREPHDGFEVVSDVAAIGEHQARNAALAIACVSRTRSFSNDALARAARQALVHCVLPGRMEVVGRSPLALVDAAHTADSMSALAELLGSLPCPRTHLVLSVSTGKRLQPVLQPLLDVLPDGSEIGVTRAERHRSLEPDEVRAAITAAKGGTAALDVRVVPNPHLALRAALEAAKPDELVLATGSVYLAGIAREVWGRASTRPVVVSRRSQAKGAGGGG